MFWFKKSRPGQAKIAAGDATPDDVLDGMSYQRISYAELAKATNGFADTNLIGAGKFGSVYLGTLPLVPKGASAPENVAVAVKVFDLRQVGASKTFLSECEALRNVRHRNLIRIITCCAGVDASGNDFRALVFEFMPNYSLDRWVNMKSLSVIQRLNIAVDIADVLCYLHNNSVPPIVHCDVKPSNVLLGEDMRAVVADFGLAKLLHEPGSHDDYTSSATSTIGLEARLDTSRQVTPTSSVPDIAMSHVTCLNPASICVLSRVRHDGEGVNARRRLQLRDHTAGDLYREVTHRRRVQGRRADPAGVRRRVVSRQDRACPRPGPATGESVLLLRGRRRAYVGTRLPDLSCEGRALLHAWSVVPKAEHEGWGHRVALHAGTHVSVRLGKVAMEVDCCPWNTYIQYKCQVDCPFGWVRSLDRCALPTDS
jgi:hypothetical protein